MPYRLTSDGKGVEKWQGGKWVLLKRYPIHAKALAYLRALYANVKA